MAKIKRPPDSWSRLATDLAVTIGFALRDEGDTRAELEFGVLPQRRMRVRRRDRACACSAWAARHCQETACTGSPGCECARTRRAKRSLVLRERSPARRERSRSPWKRLPCANPHSRSFSSKVISPSQQKTRISGNTMQRATHVMSAQSPCRFGCQAKNTGGGESGSC